ncbi:hypothetical protein [Haloarchaeobius iranensis]|uniref:Uncharacterized protein n=1 Tax=Haloarchaeobius iranensis TaxID=996166 RepID=A0A1G9UG02_9EURY|nr:hypothetical protein [Haloarchaeobius iranensis]SDM58852.1 hypothetical protein SAMN05192554_104108 [Haloarchaeobius iranensis]
MSTEDKSNRRIMDQFGEESRIPYLNISEGDVGVVVVVPILAMLVVAMTVDAFILPTLVLSFLLMLGVVYVTPSHLTAPAYLGAVYRHLKRPNWTYSVPYYETMTETSTDTTANEGGLLNYTPFKPDERTQDLTNIERAWPGAGAIQRRDGVMEAYVQVEPGNMDFAMADDWAAIQEACSEFANKELDFQLKFHATTSTYPVEKLVERLNQRMLDDDVQNNPIFAELLDEYRERRPSQMRARGAQELQFYIGVRVDEFEIKNRYEHEPTPLEKLSNIPLLGILFSPFVGRHQDRTEAERHMAMFDRLDDRLATIEGELVQNINGWDSRRLSTVELFGLCLDFWNGEEHDFGTASESLTASPAIGRTERGEVDD